MYLKSVNPYSIAKQHKKDKLHIIERIPLLFDKGSFTEYYPGESSKQELHDLPKNRMWCRCTEALW